MAGGGGLSQGSQTPCPSLPLGILMAVLLLLHSLALTLSVSSHLLVTISIAVSPSLAFVLFVLSKPLCHFLLLILLAGDAHGGRGIRWSCSLPHSYHPAEGLGHHYCQLNEGGNNE